MDAVAEVPGLRAEIRYAGSHNFLGRRVDGYEAARCLLTREAAAALAQVQRDLAPRGLGLKVFDCYRPARAAADMLRWAETPGQEGGKGEFFPRVDKRDLFRLGYIGRRSGHSRGSTVDLTLVGRDGRELDMGGPFDLFDSASAIDHPSVGPAERARRRQLRAAMVRRGFVPYDKEWWHFTLRPEPYPRTYFDVPVR